ncbi:unknown [Eggerthella sp. CAG:368]|nr:unknown [Eggerthella sp. CAG:368]
MIIGMFISKIVGEIADKIIIFNALFNVILSALYHRTISLIKRYWTHITHFVFKSLIKIFKREGNGSKINVSVGVIGCLRHQVTLRILRHRSVRIVRGNSEGVFTFNAWWVKAMSKVENLPAHQIHRDRVTSAVSILEYETVFACLSNSLKFAITLISNSNRESNFGLCCAHTTRKTIGVFFSSI